MKRTPFTRKPHWKPLSPISKDPRRRALRFIPKMVQDEVRERSGGQCEAFVYEDGEPVHVLKAPTISLLDESIVRCEREASKCPHHIKPRSRGGKHTAENLMDLCFICHRWVHDNPDEATKRGLLK